ncbi:MAG TPA: DUF2339 domain-containing protein [Puia sp.]|jgi:uncharacterized membrane protein|nr:DUF2339 domain-containing protein [Puia sp.]
MEAIFILLIVVLVALVMMVRAALLERFDRLEHEIVRLREEIRAHGSAQAHEPVKEKAPASPAPVASAPSRPEPPIPAASRPLPPQETEPYRPSRPTHAAPTVRENIPVAASQNPPTSPVPLHRAAQPANSGFFERHPDLEKFIGENLVSKIGIAILVLAIGFFVKYAIDNDWIGPAGRVGVGVLCGGILIGIAHWLRNQYKAFSSVLVGGGLAVLYCTIALAYHQYQLFGQSTAFVVMLVITAFSVILSLLYDRQELAIIALVGGFITPFLVSNGRGNYIVLFTYLLILNGGLLVIAYNKAWRLLNIFAFGFTALLFFSWLVSLPYDAADAVYRGGWAFATAFYLLFFVINIAYTIRKNRPFIASDFIILLVNTCLYFAAALYLIEQLGLDRYKGIFCAAMGVFHLAATWFLFRQRTVDKNILYLLVGITLSFVSLTAPLQLHGHYITLFWASESVLLYWLYVRSQIRLIRLSSMLIWAAMLVSLLMDWADAYRMAIYGLPASARMNVPLPIVFNKGFVTGLYAALCSGSLYYLQRGATWGRTTLITAAVVLFAAGALEINYQFGYYFPGIDLTLVYLLLYTYLFVTGLAVLTGRKGSDNFRLPIAGLLLAGVLLYLVSLVPVFGLQESMLYENRYGGHFVAHWAGDAVVVYMLWQLIGRMRSGSIGIEPALFTWVICTITVILLSAEGQLLVNALYFSKEYDLPELARIYSKTALPILWGLCSFAFMWLGMRHKFKPLRIVSLVLFTITLVKLFLFDIRNIPVAGKIAAFFCLGVLLLVVSFMYQRLKKIIIEDEEKKLV